MHFFSFSGRKYDDETGNTWLGMGTSGRSIYTAADLRMKLPGALKHRVTKVTQMSISVPSACRIRKDFFRGLSLSRWYHSYVVPNKNHATGTSLTI